MSALVSVLLVAALSLTPPDDRSTLIASGGDLNRGTLLNRSSGLRPGDAPDPRLPTFVFVHGFNPVPRAVHFEMAERLAEAVGRRFGRGRFNVLDWDWNGATFAGLHYDRNTEAAVVQGPLLAEALVRSGLDPGRVQLIGHSHGAIVVASAARSLRDRGHPPVAQLTFLEAAGYYHDVVFDRLGSASNAARVENYWSPGPSAWGRPSGRAGVIDVRVPSRTPLVGIVAPGHSGHVDIVRWYVSTAACGGRGVGLDASLLLGR